MADFPVSQIKETIVDVAQFVPQERVQSCTVRSWMCPLPRFRRSGYDYTSLQSNMKCDVCIRKETCTPCHAVRPCSFDVGSSFR